MSDGVAFGCTAPLRLSDGEPYIIVYDPGKLIRNRLTNLAPFDSIVHISHTEKEWTNALDAASDRSWIILLIFPDETEIQITDFVTQHVLNHSQLHSIYLIPRDQSRCSAQVASELRLQLCWCRSLTSELYRDIREMCACACQKYLSFYEQQRRKAEEDIRLDNDQSARSIARLFARKHQEYTRFLFQYYKKLSEQSD